MTTGRKIAVNFGWLLGGRGTAAVIALAATVLTARALGAELFGMVVLIHTSALVIRQLCKIKTAEAVIRFGVPLRDRGDEAAWQQLLGGLFRLDLATAGLAAAVALAVNALAAPALDVAPALQQAAWWYALALACSCTSTAKGALRVYDRYALLGALLAAGPAARLAGVATAHALDAPAAWYVLAWAVGLLVEDLVILAVAGRVLGRSGLSLTGSLRAACDAAPGLKGFLVVLYWQSNLDVFPRQAATLLVGAWFGAAGAGVFRLARDIAEVLGKPVALLRQAIFPDLSRLWLRDPGRFLGLTARVSGAMLGVGCVFVVAALAAGGPLLAWLAGPEYRAGAGVLALLLAAATLELGGASLRPACYTVGRAHAVLWIQAGALACYFPVFFLLAEPVGLVAAGWAAVAMAAVSLGGVAWLLWRTLRDGPAVRPDVPPGAGSKPGS